MSEAEGTSTTSTGRSELSQLVFSSLFSVLSTTLSLGFGIWGVILYTLQKDKTFNVDNCKAETINNLLLSQGIVDLILGSISFLSIFSGWFEIYYLQKSQPEDDDLLDNYQNNNNYEEELTRKKPITACGYSLRILLGCASLALLITMSIFNYNSKCRELFLNYYSIINIYLVVQYVFIGITGICWIAQLSQSIYYFRKKNSNAYDYTKLNVVDEDDDELERTF
ncbi:hypothetical protein ABK040_007560 [Willaertia magna]